MFALVRALIRLAQEVSDLRQSVDRLTEALTKEPQIESIRWNVQEPEKEV